MFDDEERSARASGPGSVLVRPAEFAGIDRACTEFLRVLAQVGGLAAEIGAQEWWGLGESRARLLSAPAFVGSVRVTADGSGSSVCAVLAAHTRVVEDIRQSHRIARDRLALADGDWGERLRAAGSTVGQHDSAASGAGR
ncbi:hypothetical protein [Nocardia sp. SSK8]|uniref:hypothetical protein n=1 Tax=Nocardia sp. SSK8 TaxID=3120154 RepID=UPI0030097619